MLADKALGDKQGGTPQALLGGLKVTVDRNHFGSQLKSFETESVIDCTPVHQPARAREH